MSTRILERSAAIIDGRSIPGYKLLCLECDKEEIVKANGYSGTMNQDALARMARNKGWVIGKKGEAGDTCPDCVKKAERDRRLKRAQSAAERKHQKDEPMTNATSMVDDSGELTRTAKRIVRLKMDEVYPVEEQGYIEGWSDARVAADLAVDVRHIISIRDQDYGPESLRRDMSVSPETVARLDKIEADLRTAENDIVDTVSQLEAFVVVRDGAARKLQTAQTLMDKARSEVQELTTQVDNYSTHINRLRRNMDEALKGIAAIRQEIDLLTQE